MAANPNKKLMHIALQEAQNKSIGLVQDADPGEMLQRVLDRASAMFVYAATRVDALPPEKLSVMTAFGPMDNEWVRMEEHMRDEVARLCATILKADVQDRFVRVAEARAMIMMRAMKAACEEVGIPQAKIKALGPALRRQLEAVEVEKVAA